MPIIVVLPILFVLFLFFIQSIENKNNIFSLFFSYWPKRFKEQKNSGTFLLTLQQVYFLAKKNKLENSEKKYQSLFKTSYKFYLEIFLTLIQYFVNYGMPLEKSYLFFRKILLNHREFDQKFLGHISSLIFQIFFGSILIWIFIISTIIFLPEISFSSLFLGIIGSIQLCGIVFFMVFLQLLEKYYFHSLSQELKSLILWRSLLFLPLSTGEILKESAVETLIKHYKTTLFKKNKKNFQEEKNHLFQRLEDLVLQWQTFGENIHTDLENLLNEWWFYYENLLQLFEKKAKALGLFFLTLFVFSSYLLFLGYLMLKFLGLGLN